MRVGPIGPSAFMSRCRARLCAAFSNPPAIGAGAEVLAAAAQDRDLRIGIGVESAESLHQQLRGRAVDRVARSRPVQRDDPDLGIAFDGDGAHRVPFSSAMTAGILLALTAPDAI